MAYVHLSFFALDELEGAFMRQLLLQRIAYSSLRCVGRSPKTTSSVASSQKRAKNSRPGP